MSEPNICEFTLEDGETQENLAPLTETWIAQAMNFSTKLTQKENAKKEDTQTLPKTIPPELHEYLDVFDKERANISQNLDLGIMQLNSRTTSSPRTAKYIP